MKHSSAKQEQFCILLAQGESQAEAYRQAYPNSQKWKDKALYSRASVVANRREVIERVEQLRQPAIEAAGITFESHLKELARLKKKAEELDQTQVALKAEELRGKVAGLYIERRENLNRTDNVNQFSDADLLAIIQGRTEGAA